MDQVLPGVVLIYRRLVNYIMPKDTDRVADTDKKITLYQVSKYKVLPATRHDICYAVMNYSNGSIKHYRHEEK